MSKPKITKQVNGKHEEVPIEELWDSICKVIRKARVAAATSASDPADYLARRMSALCERLEDLDGYTFHDKIGPL